ncbi:SGNH hydrolase-type esterase domain-containing protein, partial [Peziza echinospora]
MQFSASFIALVAAAMQMATSGASAQRILLAGDSTMAKTSTANMQGWGVPFADYVTLPVINLARGGRSARSYTREGLFAELVAQVQKGDYVVIEFGHNDGGSPTSSDRAPAAGYGAETQVVTLADGTVETVQTFTTYLKWAARDIIAKGGIPLISSTTPNGDAWTADLLSVAAPNRFVEYAWRAYDAYKGQGATYIDHYDFVAHHYEALGYSAVYPTLFPNDHTHTNAAGADVVARAFVSGIACTSHALTNSLSAKGKSFTRLCGGGKTIPAAGTTTTTVAKYGQCGGIGYTGSTTCVSGSTCTG